MHPSALTLHSREREMREIVGRTRSPRRCRCRLLLPVVASFFFIASAGYDSSHSKNSTKGETHGRGSVVVGVLLVFVAVIMVSYFLYKLWQRKKREEQYARLLKLFEEDDELEVELGLRD